MAEGGFDPGQPKYRVACRYFLQGKCFKGENCMYLHDASLKAPPRKNVCRYYQLGCCAYGAKCRYDHVKATKEKEAVPEMRKIEFRNNTQNSGVSGGKSPASMVTLTKGGVDHSIKTAQKKQDYERKWVQAADFIPGQKYHGSTPLSYAAAVQPGTGSNFQTDNQSYSGPLEVQDSSLLCPYYGQSGDCPYSGKCGYTHALICDMCGLPRLHPTDEKQRKEHEKECLAEHEKEMELAFAIQASKDKECGICLENIMDKEGISSDTRFGILENCNHCFCLSCIRTWRFNKSSVIQTQRTCPTCRTHSDFVTPSKFWVETPEEKQFLIAEYKSAMQSKPCQYFKQGKGVCPFDTKCFYLHALEDGTVVEGNVRKQRKRTNAEGENILEEQSILWDFISRREEEGGLLSLEDELSLVLLGIFEDSDDEDTGIGVRYNFHNGEFVFTDTDSDSSED